MNSNHINAGLKGDSGQSQRSVESVSRVLLSGQMPDDALS